MNVMHVFNKQPPKNGENIVILTKALS